MYIIFNSLQAAQDAHGWAKDKCGVPAKKTNDLVDIINHPSKNKAAIFIRGFISEKSWYREFEAKGDEVVSELSDDWFEDEV